MSILADSELSGFKPSHTTKLAINSPPRHLSNAVHKVYKQASSLFLTRRLRDAYDIILTLIQPPEPTEDSENELAPIKNATQVYQIKIWSLYITAIDEIIKLGADEGKATFGGSLWKSIQSKARDGSIWEEVVQAGYDGNEGAVDPVLVSGLSTLLLAHSSSQNLNQQRLESYLASSVAGAQQNGTSEGPERQNGSLKANSSAMNSLRYSTARIKVLELYALHVLPKNGEWEYAKDFINLNDDLDQDHRDSFLQALEAQQQDEDDSDTTISRGTSQPSALRTPGVSESRREEDGVAKPVHDPPPDLKPTSSSSDQTEPSQKIAEAPVERARSTNKPPSAKSSGVPAQASKKRRPVDSKSNPFSVQSKPVGGLKGLLSLMQAYLRRIAQTFASSPMSLLRTVLFIMGLLLVMGRRDVRDRIRRMTALSWNKIRGTAGMGVKVSYM